VKGLALVLIVVSSFYVMGKMIGRSMDPTFGQAANASSAPIQGLPSDATAIRYRIGGAFDAVPLTYEFTISEPSFVRWATAKGMSLSASGNDIVGGVSGSVSINNGLFFNRMTGDDSGEHAAYDKVSGRAYYHSHTR
jgi:hypothetical protein